MFLCGGYKRGRNHNDIQPADFLGGRDWWPDDEELDRRLRGRLRPINWYLAHLSWERSVNEDPLGWSTTFMAHEAHYAMGLFIEELKRTERLCLLQFEAAQRVAGAKLPRLKQKPQTEVEPAPPRTKPESRRPKP